MISWLLSNKWRTSALIAWLLALFVLIWTLFWFRPYVGSIDKKVAQKEQEALYLRLQLEEQIKVSDSLGKVASLVFYEVRRDTVKIVKIEKRYETKKDSISNLPVSGQVEFLSKWLSEDSGDR